jgi:hypothetical protein
MPFLDTEVLRLSGDAVGARGSGKTLLAAWIIFHTFLAGIGWICIDPMGKLSEYLLERIIAAGDPGLWKRVIYIPVGGLVFKDRGDTRPDDELTEEEVVAKSWLVPTPFLYRRGGGDFLQDQTARPLRLWQRLSPESENAPVQGMPAIKRTATYAGMLLAAAGGQLVPDAAYLIDAMSVDTKRTSAWARLIREVESRHPWQLHRAAHYFLQQFPDMRPNDQLGHTSTFMGLIDPYVTNPRLAAQYGANAWGVELAQAERGALILFDCQYLPEEEHRTGTSWIFTRFMEYARARGSRRDLVGFALDELSYLVDRDNRLLEKDFEDLIARLGRNFGLSCLVTYQQVTQPPPRLQQVLANVGYRFFSGTSDPEAVQRLTALMDDYRPRWVKDSYTMYAPTGWGEAYDQQRDLYFSPQEQVELNKPKYRKTPPLTFRLMLSPGEGTAAQYAGTVHIRDIHQSQPFHLFPQLEEAKRRLVKTHGRRIADVLAEIEARQPGSGGIDTSQDRRLPSVPPPDTPSPPNHQRWDTEDDF